jgi:DNA mismatch repair protein MutL
MTLGFRGEALASIASVARLAIRSRTATDAAASIVEAAGGDVKPVRPEAGPVGTSVAVRNLFFNTPARRKFLRTIGTEQGHCEGVVRALALSHPHVGFTLIIDGKKSLDLPAGQGPRDRAMAVLGREMESQYIQVHADHFDDARGMSLWGLVGRPGLAKPTTAAQHVFVNGRPIRDKTITHALREGFRGLIEPSRHPAALLMIVMDPGAVDVNVHPAKAEVRFRDSGMIHAAVYRAVRDALREADVTPQVAPSWGAVAPRGLAGPEANAGPGQPGSPQALSDRFVDYFKRPPATGAFDYTGVRDGVAAHREPAIAPPLPAAPGHADSLPRPMPAQRVLQVHNSYLVTQDEQGVLIIDQHALHERIMFERLKERLAAGNLESQRLLMPAVAAVEPQRMELLGPLAPLLDRLGVVAEPIGPRQVAVHAFPTFLFDKRVDPAAFVAELLERAESQRWVAEGGELANVQSISEDLLHDILDMMACKAAIKAGDALSETDVAEILRLREGIDRASNCPHGRPTTIRVTLGDLDKLFGRA